MFISVDSMHLLACVFFPVVINAPCLHSCYLKSLFSFLEDLQLHLTPTSLLCNQPSVHIGLVTLSDAAEGRP